MIKCACGSKECPIELYINGKELWFIDKQGHETLMYLSPNSIVELIYQLKEALACIVNEPI